MATIKDVNIRINVQDGDIKSTEKDFDSLNSSVNKGSKEMSTSLGKLNSSLLTVGASLVGIFAIKAIIGDATKRILAFDESIADLRKTTNLSNEAARELATTLLKIDTRTSVTELVNLATAAGRLGVAQKDIRAFVEQTDRLFVALGDDLGGSAEEIATNIGKIVNVFGVEEAEGLAEGLNKVGSVFNDLAANSKANAGFILDFTNRLAGVAPAANLSVTEVAAFATVLDEAGQSVEVAATTLNQLIPLIGKDIPKFAKLAGKDLKEFTKTLEEDAFAAIIQVLEGAKSASGGVAGLAETLKAVGVDGSRAASILSILSNNTEDLVKFQEQANKAFEEGTSLSAEFAIKNETLSANIEKLDNNYEKFILSIEDGNGVLSNAVKSIVEFGNEILNFGTELNEAEAASGSFFDNLEIAALRSEGISGFIAATELELTALEKAFRDKSITIGHEIAVLRESLQSGGGAFGSEIAAAKLKELETQLESAEKGFTSLGGRLDKIGGSFFQFSNQTEESTEATEENTEATNKNILSKKEQLAILKEIERQRKLIIKDQLLTLRLDDEAASNFEFFVDRLDKENAAIEEQKEKERQIIADHLEELNTERLELSDRIEAEAQEIRDLEEEEHQKRIDRNVEIAQSAANLAGSLSELAKKGSVEARGLATIQVIINGAVAITQALAQLGPIAGAIAAAAIVATTAVQLNKINNTKSLKDGEVNIDGAGTETSDSIPAFLSRGETVTTAKQTRKHMPVLKAIHDDRFDDYLNKIVMKRLYMGKSKEKVKSSNSKAFEVNIPNGYKILNPSSIHKPITDALVEYAFLNQGRGWE